MRTALEMRAMVEARLASVNDAALREVEEALEGVTDKFEYTHHFDGPLPSHAIDYVIGELQKHGYKAKPYNPGPMERHSAISISF